MIFELADVHTVRRAQRHIPVRVLRSSGVMRLLTGCVLETDLVIRQSRPIGRSPSASCRLENRTMDRSGCLLRVLRSSDFPRVARLCMRHLGRIRIYDCASLACLRSSFLSGGVSYTSAVSGFGRLGAT